MRKQLSNPWLFITFALVIPVTVFISLKWFSGRFDDLPVYTESMPIYTASLVNQHNHHSDAFDSNTQITVVNFFFTSCPLICPEMTKNIKTVQHQYLDDAEVLFVSFTVDPEKDNSNHLRKYIENKEINDQNWDFLTGDKQLIYKLARNSFGVVALNTGGVMPDFIHSDKIVLLDRKNRIRGYYKGTDQTEIKQLIKDIKKLKDEPSDFVTR